MPKIKSCAVTYHHRTPVEPMDREHPRDCLHLDHAPDGVCGLRYREDRVALWEHHADDPRRGCSTVWFPNGSRAYVPHGRQGQGLEALGAALACAADEAWRLW
jgi:hypothetical protein